MEIESTRLALRPLSRGELHELLTGAPPVLAGVNTASLSLSPVQQRAIRIKMDKLKKAAPSEAEWHTYWLIIRSKDRTAMGLAGFKGLGADGSAEIGYGITPRLREQGYMKEAVMRLLQWAEATGACRLITAAGIDKENTASRRLLQCCGFHPSAETRQRVSYVLPLRKVSASL
mgnify:CR=1 FL=1